MDMESVRARGFLGLGLKVRDMLISLFSGFRLLRGPSLAARSRSWARDKERDRERERSSGARGSGGFREVCREVLGSGLAREDMVRGLFAGRSGESGRVSCRRSSSSSSSEKGDLLLTLLASKSHRSGSDVRNLVERF